MIYVIAGLMTLTSLALGLYAFLKKSELATQVSALREQIEEEGSSHASEVARLQAELAKLNKYAHIPDIFERARKTESGIAARLQHADKRSEEIVRKANSEAERTNREIAGRLEQLQQRTYEILQAASREANALKEKILGEIESDQAKAKEARRIAEWQANNLIEEAQKKTKEIASQARKEAKEKTRKVDETLSLATAYALEIRTEAERRAEEIGGKAYEARNKRDFYEAAAEAMRNVVSGYEGTYLVPAAHILDEMADEYGFHRAGEKLKLARQRTSLMEKNGTAATCNYPEGWKRDYAIKFVLSAFNGKVDSILSRVKPANQGKLAQEIKDTFALVNHNGEVFRNARIHEEFLDARLEELKWAVAVQRLKEKAAEEQRAIREQMREEEKARREYEKTIKQAEREEEIISKAIEKMRKEFEQAGEAEKVEYEAKLQTLATKLKEAEEKGQKAMSMAQQTKCGYVYVISNIGSFGEDVYKIGLTRRLEPTDRVRELGDASVPFPFDIHAMIYSDEAPSLETALHKQFLSLQVNKANRRKEFFRLKLQDIRQVVEQMGLDVHWTIMAEAKEYRETLILEQAMKANPDLKKHWIEEQASYEDSRQDPYEDDEPLEEVSAASTGRSGD